LQKARIAVRELPDLERSLREQEEEIRELEGKIARQKVVLKSLGSGRREGDVMEGLREG